MAWIQGECLKEVNHALGSAPLTRLKLTQITKTGNEICISFLGPDPWFTLSCLDFDTLYSESVTIIQTTP